MFSGSKCVANHREEQSAGQTKMLWITLALIAAACTSLTVIFAKIGIKYVNSDFATFYRTGIVVVFSLILCAISGNLNTVASLTAENFVFLGLSGIATGFYSSASNTRPLSDYPQTYELADHTQHEFPSNMRY